MKGPPVMNTIRRAHVRVRADQMMPFRAMYALIGISMIALGATTAVPIKLLWVDFTSPAFYYLAGAACLAATIRLSRRVAAVSGALVVFVSMNRAAGFYELIDAGNSNLWGSFSQQIVVAALSLRLTLGVIERADR